MYIYDENTQQLSNDGVLVRDFSDSRVLARCKDRSERRVALCKYCMFKFETTPTFMGV